MTWEEIRIENHPGRVIVYMNSVLVFSFAKEVLKNYPELRELMQKFIEGKLNEALGRDMK